MARKPPRTDVDEANLEVSKPKSWAAGIRGVAVSLRRSVEQMGLARTARTLSRLNQRNGFDCPGCAWPEPTGRRKPAEFCENGAKAVAEEATTRRVDRAFFAQHSLDDLAGKSGHWLEQQGRLAEPMVLREGDTHYRPISWSNAFDLISQELRSLHSPDEAVFYTSGRTSNEAAFAYQLFARSFGTNNLPDCSNMCHESSGAALSATIGVGKGSVSIDDIEAADLLLIVGQNPGSNHPRMLSSLEKAKERGAEIIAINPLPEAGLMRFRNPQTVRGVLGSGTPLADQFCQLKLGGDQAFFQALGALLLEQEDAAPGTVLDHEFLEQHVAGFEEYAAHLRALDWDAVTEAVGLSREQLERVAQSLIRSRRTITCWAMGLTQHPNSVPTIREIVNVMLLRGMIGKTGAGVCPVRGHSNVQGDRTMGIWEKMPEAFLDRLDGEFGISAPREHGYDTVNALRALHDGRARVFVGMGGNFAAATPDTAVTERALSSCSLTVHVSTKLNRSHIVHGRTALILPTRGRTERDRQASGEQFVTVEDSMSVVHASRGRVEPASTELLSEVAIICRLARTVLGADHPVPWAEFERDYDTIRERIAAVVPGCAEYNAQVRQADGFVLPHPPRDSRTFPTASGYAHLTANELWYPRVPAGRLLLQTLRSHDQYNTTIYGTSDRYRGVQGGRRVVFLNSADCRALGVADGQIVDLVSEFGPTGAVTKRRVEHFRVVAYPTARGCAAAYFPEANNLVALDSTAETSNTPASKSIVVRLEPIGAPTDEPHGAATTEPVAEPTTATAADGH